MKATLLLAAALAALFVSGCGGSDSSSGSGPSRLRVIHASQDAGSLDVEVQGAPFATELNYGGSFPSGGLSAASVASGANFVTVLESGTSTVLDDISASFEAGHTYTVVAAGLRTGPTADALRTIAIDEPTNELNTANTYARIVHASPNVGAADVYITGLDDSIATATPTVQNLSRYGVSGRIALPTGAYRIRVCPTGSKTPKINITATGTAGQYVVGVLENDDSDGAVLANYSGAF